MLVSVFAGNVSDAFAKNAASAPSTEPESAKACHVIYRDTVGSIIQRIPFAKGYEFDEAFKPVTEK